MVGGDEDAAKDMGVFIDGIERLRTTLRATVMTLHHPTKNQAAERGSGALRGAMDTVLRLSVSQRVIEMRCEKQKDAEEFPNLYMSLQPVELPGGGRSCVVEPALPPQSPIRAGESSDFERISPASRRRMKSVRVLDALANAPAGLTPSQIREALVDVKERTLFRWLDRLQDEGAIESKRGVYRLRTHKAATVNPLPEDGSDSGSDT
jgi:DNA-binding transcriptional ArsR family regulator